MDASISTNLYAVFKEKYDEEKIKKCISPCTNADTDDWLIILWSDLKFGVVNIDSTYSNNEKREELKSGDALNFGQSIKALYGPELLNAIFIARGNNEKQCYDIAKKLLSTKQKKRKSKQSQDDKRSEDIPENENLEEALKVKKKVIREENKKKNEARSQAAFQKAKSMFGAEAIKLHEQVESSKTASNEDNNSKAADSQPVTSATNSSNLTPLINLNQSSLTNCQQPSLNNLQQPSSLNNWQQPSLITNNWQQSSPTANCQLPLPCTTNWQQSSPTANCQLPLPCTTNWQPPLSTNWQQPLTNNWHHPSPGNWHQSSPNNWQQPSTNNWQPPLPSNWQHSMNNTNITNMSPIPSAHRSAFSNVVQPKPIRNLNTNTSNTSLFNPFEVMAQDDPDFEANSESLFRESSTEVSEEELEITEMENVSNSTSMHEAKHVNETPKTILSPLSITNSCPECLIKEEKIKALELQLSIAKQDIKTKESEAQKDKVQQGQQEGKELKRRCSKLTRTDYKILLENMEMPSGYQHLVSGGNVIIKTSWLKETLLKLRKKDATCALKMMIDCFMSPYQYGIRGGTSAFKGTELEPVMTDIEKFGLVYFKLTQTAVVRAINEKMYSGRKYLSLTGGQC